MTYPDPELIALQQEWAPAWKIWRARRSMDRDNPDLREGDYVASLMDHSAGVHPTVIKDNPAKLRTELQREAEMARAGVRPLEISPICAL